MDRLAAWKDRRVLVTGGTGFIGQRVLLGGIKAGIQMYNLAVSGQAPSGVTSYQTDLRRHDLIRSIIQEIHPEAIIHLAAGGVAYGTENMFDLLQTNVIGMQVLLEAASQLSPKPSIVIAGSWFEYKPRRLPLKECSQIAPRLPYSVSKAAANMLAAYYAMIMPVTVLRLFSVYGPGEPFPRLIPYIIEEAIAGKPIALTLGEQVRDFVYVDDIGESFWRALLKPPVDTSLRTINVGTGIGKSVRECVHLLTEILKTYGLSPDIEFGKLAYRENENMYAVANIAYLKRTLNWCPTVSIQTGLTRTVAARLRKTDGITHG